MRLLLLTIGIVLISFKSTALWTKMSDLPAKGRHRGTGIAIGNKGYIGLGHFNGTGVNVMLQDWWEYDPGNNTWTQKANYPSLNYAALAFGTTTKGYVGGGITGGNSFYEFDPMQNTWTPKATLPASITDHTGFVINDKCYYMSGSQVFEYDPSSNSWTTKGPCPIGGAFWNTSFVIGEKGYIQDGSTFYEYKPSTDSWLQRASFPGSAGSATVGFSQLGEGYIVSGFGGSLSNVSSEFWRYNPSINSWTQLEDFPGSSRRFAAGFNIGNKAYFGIGTNGTNFSDFWCLDLLADISESELFKVKCYPNPASDFINLSWQDLGVAEIIICDPNGRKVFEKKTNENILSIDCTDFQKGQYFFSISVDNETQYQSTFIVR